MSYKSEVLADSPAYYWSEDLSVESGGAAITFGGTTTGAAGATVQLGAARSFNGTSDDGAVALTLSDTSVLTVEYWLLWDTNGADDDFALEYSANANSNNGFNVDQNNSTGGAEANTVSFKSLSGALVADRWTIARPSAAAWHHYAWVLDRSGAATLAAYVDGSAVTVTQRQDDNGSGAFANTSLYLMSRAAASLFGAGDMHHLAIYKSALSSARIAAHFAAASASASAAKSLAALGVG